MGTDSKEDKNTDQERVGILSGITNIIQIFSICFHSCLLTYQSYKQAKARMRSNSLWYNWNIALTENGNNSKVVIFLRDYLTMDWTLWILRRKNVFIPLI